MKAVVSRNRLESPEADVAHYLEHFPKCSIPQFPNNFPNFLWVNVSVYMFILLLLLIGPQLKYLPKIEERHLAGRELQCRGCGLFGYFRQENIAVPPDAELKTANETAYGDKMKTDTLLMEPFSYDNVNYNFLLNGSYS